MAKIKVTLVKSAISYKADQKKTLKALGLGKMNSTVVHNDSAPIRGMIHKVRHLVSIEEEK